MLTDFAEIWWLVCNLTCQRWRRISLKSDVVCQRYGNVYRGTVFSWTRCILECAKKNVADTHSDTVHRGKVSLLELCTKYAVKNWRIFSRPLRLFHDSKNIKRNRSTIHEVVTVAANSGAWDPHCSQLLKHIYSNVLTYIGLIFTSSFNKPRKRGLLLNLVMDRINQSIYLHQVVQYDSRCRKSTAWTLVFFLSFETWRATTTTHELKTKTTVSSWLKGRVGLTRCAAFNQYTLPCILSWPTPTSTSCNSVHPLAAQLFSNNIITRTISNAP